MASMAPPPLPPDVSGQMGKQPFSEVGGMLADKLAGSDKGGANPLGDVEASMDAVERILTNVSKQNDVAAPYVKRILDISKEMMAEIKSAGAPGTQPKEGDMSKTKPPMNSKLQGNTGTAFPG